MEILDVNLVKERCLKLIVKAIMELEDTNKLKSVSIIFEDSKISIKGSGNISYTKIYISKESVDVYWLSYHIVLKRAKSEEEYFQSLCLDDMYCDEEIEEGIKLMFDLYTKSLEKQFAIGGFKEGVYAEDNRDS